MKNNFHSVGIGPSEILLPGNNSDYSKWAVVACDQFTSQPEYWHEVEEFIGGSPSTYNLILPEAFLETKKGLEHSDKINSFMNDYINSGFFKSVKGMILIERSFDRNTRKGLITCLDLELYDYSAGSQSLIRATEGTIVNRLPPRIKIRQKAFLEIPHILVLIDDPNHTVIEPIADKTDALDLLYDFELMQGSGHIKGFHVNSGNLEREIINALENLKSPQIQSKKYNIKEITPPLLFAVGDGNHSLATAKAVWEKTKSGLPEDHPARYALVEIGNLHDPGIIFEPIHRLLIGAPHDLTQSLKNYFNQEISISEVPDFETLKTAVSGNKSTRQIFGFMTTSGFFVIALENPGHTLTVGSIQNWVNELLKEKIVDTVDYIHGDETILALGTSKNNAGIYLQAMQKDSLFKSVINDGALPRKTFSMGEAHQKRFYLECRRIK